MIQPINRQLHDEAKALGVTAFTLRFSGGSDEGYLDIDIETLGLPDVRDLRAKIEKWAWDAYDYSGAGDGHDYGDEITYDLVKGEVSHTEWIMERHESFAGAEALVTEGGSEE